ncbi:MULTISPECIES: enoyl-CoA hydratase/isomerase family protein [unclassified Variovorax]|uniref:enoyl-CoA hydratase/isomerase family protein n=1 Tax=unclassified Variovorax TaxID=663243 RepID=UPI0008D52912|nr:MULTISPECIES: enoyl-CoA hydratase-related protein [unclassified Variovorax]SEK16142.1 enoyl-CoA hydratase/enoyl-CoA hydratase [Variovorax sp. OK202]SFE34989.1 enoyl-CoA hydratase/enoyl-CoA hydratase [Variovorax sp. OK212]
MTGETVRYEADGPIARVTLDRPQRHNALNPRAMRRLGEIWHDFMLARELRVAVLSGEGPSFCSGMDIGETHPGFGYLPEAAARQDDVERDAARRHEALPGERRRLLYVPPPELGKPVIAALHGRVSGGGLELALACDLRIAAEGTVFALPEVTRGIIPTSGAIYWLPRIVGLGRALELLLTGESLDAEEALRIGLVNKLVPRDLLDEAASAMAQRIARNAPLAVQALRDAVIRSSGAGAHEGLAIAENLGRNLRTTADYAEGFRAFAEKRAPDFSGR